MQTVGISVPCQKEDPCLTMSTFKTKTDGCSARTIARRTPRKADLWVKSLLPTSDRER